MSPQIAEYDFADNRDSWLDESDEFFLIFPSILQGKVVVDVV